MQVSLDDEFVAATAAATLEHFDWLIARGVSKEFLWLGAMRFGVAEIDTTADGFYQPREGGALAYIMPARPLAPPWSDDFLDEDRGDLVAWLPSNPARWWCRTGACPILDPEGIERAVHFRLPLRVWSSPLAWLIAGGAGVVILSRHANLRLWLGDVPSILPETYELGDAIERRLRGRDRLPAILVPRRAA